MSDQPVQEQATPVKKAPGRKKNNQCEHCNQTIRKKIVTEPSDAQKEIRNKFANAHVEAKRIVAENPDLLYKEVLSTLMKK